MKDFKNNPNMESISIKRDELLFIYRQGDHQHKEILTAAKALDTHVKEMELKDVTPTMWQTLLSWLKLQPQDLFMTSHEVYQQKIAGKDFDQHDWLTLLHEEADLIHFPIAAIDGKAVLCQQRNDILKIHSNRDTNAHVR